MTKETSKPISPEHLAADKADAGPWWSRVPKGWIILGLFLLAWLGIILVWNGVTFVVGR